MWIAIIGAPGSCKAAVAQRLAKDNGFRVEREAATHVEADFAENAFDIQLDYMLARYRLQRTLQRRAGEEDLLQIRTFWDTLHVYAVAAHARGYLKDRELHLLSKIHATLEETMETPTLVVYMHGSSMLAGDRQALTGKSSHEEDRAALSVAYAQFVSMIRVPVVDVEISENYEGMVEEVKSGIEAARASGAGGLSVWKRSFMK